MNITSRSCTTTDAEASTSALLLRRPAGSFPLQTLLAQLGETVQRAALPGFVFRSGQSLFRRNFRAILLSGHTAPAFARECKPVGHNALNVDLFRGMTTHANSNRWRYQHRRCCDRGVAISGPAAVIQLSSNRMCARQINGRAVLMQRIKFSGGCLFTVFKFRCRV
jgi:hypothetical protein